MRPLYSKALSLFESKALTALDLGCGAGVETADLLARGFHVHAIDQELKAIELIRSSPFAQTPRLSTEVRSLEYLKVWPQANFVCAFQTLPFVSRDHFDRVVARSLDAVLPGGLFVASFFGPEDDWVKSGAATGITLDALKLKFEKLSILHIEETKKVGPSSLSGDKMWHLFEVIAKRDR